MITVSDVAKSHGQRVLFRDVALRITPGARIALVGANGVGKTTLLEIIAGRQAPDEGAVARAKGVEIGYLHQEVASIAGGTVLERVLGAAGTVSRITKRLRDLEEQLAQAPEDDLLAEYGRLQDRFAVLGGFELEAEARRILAGLGFSRAQVSRDAAALSGGQMMRVVLAGMLLSHPDVLLLDEPTNHLDLSSVAWLEEFLSGYEGAVVLVSHDREFMNAVVNQVVELAGGTATAYAGDFADFVEQRELRVAQQRAAAANQARKIAETERFIERFRYKASKARQVQSRIKMLERTERVQVDESVARRMAFRLPEPRRGGRVLVRLAGVVKRYGDHTVYDGLDLVLERGQKAALVGPNGAGKSTLLKLVAGVLDPDEGDRSLGHNTTVSYFAQHQIDALDPERTVLEELRGAIPADQQVDARRLLGAFLFSGDDVDKRVAVLSGGERTRLALAKLLADPANLLCLDEPTNHLDIPSRDVLEDALADYAGALVLITHDRHLIRSVANMIVEVGDGDATVHLGGFDDYLDRKARQEAGEPAEAPTPAEQRDRHTDRKRVEAEVRNRRYRATRELREQLTRVEAELGTVEAEVADLNRTLADPATYTGEVDVERVLLRHNEAKDRAAVLMTEWERLYAAVEDATAAEA